MVRKKPTGKRIKSSRNKQSEKVAHLYMSLNGRMEHQELEAIISDSNDAIIIFSLDKKIMSWNRSAKLLYGYTRKEALKMQLKNLICKECLKENLNSFDNVAKGTPVKLFGTQHITKDKRVMYVWMSISALVNYEGETGAFVVTVRDITEQKLIMENNRYLAQEIIRAQEAERKRIAEGIHDDLGQSLIALKMFFLAHASDVSKESPIFKDKVDEMQKNIDAIIEKTRRISHELLPPNLKHIGLPRAIKKLTQMFKGNKDMTVRFVERNMNKVKLGGSDIILYRIVQECLNNIIKHACATRIVITLAYKENVLSLRIYDNGKGVSKIPKKQGHREGIGIAIMRERARLINADMSITSSPQKGTTVTVKRRMNERMTT